MKAKYRIPFPMELEPLEEPVIERWRATVEALEKNGSGEGEWDKAWNALGAIRQAIAYHPALLVKSKFVFSAVVNRTIVLGCSENPFLAKMALRTLGEAVEHESARMEEFLGLLMRLFVDRLVRTEKRVSPPQGEQFDFDEYKTKTVLDERR